MNNQETQGTTNDVNPASVDRVVHTPGPWRFYNILDGEYQEVFGPRSPGHDDRLAVIGKADARLIAAAPELLAELEDLVSGCEAADPGVYDLRDAKAAIATARGDLVV